jgi:hypothetical protein
MGVLEHHQDRAAPRARFQLPDQRREDAAAAALRIGQFGRLLLGDAEQFRKRLGVDLGPEAGSQFTAFFGRRVGGLEIRGMLDLGDDRLQRAASMMRLTEIAQAGFRFVF